MNRYLTGAAVWPDGCSKLRVYFTPRLDEVKPLIEAYLPVLEKFDFLSPVPAECLHGTTAVIDDRPTSAVSPTEMKTLESLLRERIGELKSFTVIAGGAHALRRGVLVDLTPDDEYGELQDRVKSAISDTLGEDAAQPWHDGGRPHLTFTYGTGPGDSGHVQDKLRNATSLRVPLTVTEVRLVDVSQDTVRQQLRWRELAMIPLAHDGTRADDR